MSFFRTMIVEDDKAVRDSLAAHLEDRGFEIVESPDASSALSYLENGAVDAMVVDLRLPGMSGEDLIYRVHARWPRTVFLITTGSLLYVLPNDLKQLTSVSKHIFLKPLENMDDLTDEIHRLLKIRDMPS